MGVDSDDAGMVIDGVFVLVVRNIVAVLTVADSVIVEVSHSVIVVDIVPTFCSSISKIVGLVMMLKVVVMAPGSMVDCDSNRGNTINVRKNGEDVICRSDRRGGRWNISSKSYDKRQGCRGMKKTEAGSS